MNAALTEKKIRIGEVAAAIGATPKTIRNWLDRYSDEINVGTGRGEGWIEFSLRDVCYLAVTKVLVGYGLSANQAFPFSTALLQRIWGPLLSYKKAPPAALILGLALKRLWVVIQDGEVRESYIQDIYIPGGPPEDPHALKIDLWVVVGSAMKLLADMGYETSGLSHGAAGPITKVDGEDVPPTD